MYLKDIYEAICLFKDRFTQRKINDPAYSHREWWPDRIWLCFQSV